MKRQDLARSERALSRRTKLMASESQPNIGGHTHNTREIRTLRRTCAQYLKQLTQTEKQLKHAHKQLHRHQMLADDWEQVLM